METTTKKKMSLIITIAALAAATSVLVSDDQFTATSENEVLRLMKSKMHEFQMHMPEERLYLHTDKSFYEPGNDIWFTAYLRNGEDLKASPTSDIVHAELLGPAGNIVRKINLIAGAGRAQGDFQLDENAAGGIYKIRAYTNWMKNQSEENYFEKEIQVQKVILPSVKFKLDLSRKAYGPGEDVIATLKLTDNSNSPLKAHKLALSVSVEGKVVYKETFTTDANGESHMRCLLPADLKSTDALLNITTEFQGKTESLSKSIPVILNNIRCEFFPEGGDLLAGVENSIAFRAINEFDKAADVSGMIYTSSGTEVCAFTSFHNGMGKIRFTPRSGEKYYAKLIKPVRSEEKIFLPLQWDKGYHMRVVKNDRTGIIVHVNTTEAGPVGLLLQVRGNPFYNTVINALPGNNTVTIPAAFLPAGVAQLTLFDDDAVARCERLLYVNKHKQLQVEITADKVKYLPREKVKLNITVKDEKGLPAPAMLSMAVVDDQLLSFSDDRRGNILSSLLLEQDLNTKVEEASFYFNKVEPKADEALDNLLLTSGWRRFTWEQLQDKNLPELRYTAEKAVVRGKIVDANTGVAVTNAVLSSTAGCRAVTDADGRFTLRGLDLSKSGHLNVTAEKYTLQSVEVHNYEDELVVYLYDQMNVRRNWEKKKNFPMAAEAFASGVAHAIPEMADMNVQNAVKDQHFKKEGEEKVAEVSAIEADLVEELVDRRFASKPAQEAQGRAEKLYYPARIFSSPDHSKSIVNPERTDFRSTIFWKGDIVIGHSGRTSVEFYAADDITSYRAVVEGISRAGLPGRGEHIFYTQLPFSLSSKLPVEISSGDIFSMPVTMVNNTGEPLGGDLSVETPESFYLLNKFNEVQTLMPGAAKTIYLTYKVGPSANAEEVAVSFSSCNLKDSFRRKLKVTPKGFPVNISFSAEEAEKEFQFDIIQPVTGSLKATFTAFPNVVGDLLTGMEGILQEPYGCFEQTSSSAYPNAMVLDYLKQTGSNDGKVIAKATGLLDRGYKRLTGFEARDRGYEWFGGSPAHEGLTAYGIMEFVDMKNAGQPIDEQMLQRTATWLLSHKDGNGGFQREQRALHDFGRISDEVMNGYIVYALSDAGYKEIRKEYVSACDRAVLSSDPYLLAMAAISAFNFKDEQMSGKIMNMLYRQQKENGSFEGSTHSITYSQGTSLIIETTALAMQAMLRENRPDEMALRKAAAFLKSARSGSGVFGSTQGTVLALKALTAYALFSKKTLEGGEIDVIIDGVVRGSVKYEAGEREVISLKGFEKYLTGGKHRIRVRFRGSKNPLPYTLAINYNTSLPKSQGVCKVHLETSLDKKQVTLGETVRMKVKIKNSSSEEIPSTIAVIGIPAGLSVQPFQLKELQEKKVFDYYEIIGNSLAIYYRGMAAAAIKSIDLDLKTELPGEFEAPASSAYLYYTNEFRTWYPGETIKIFSLK